MKTSSGKDIAIDLDEDRKDAATVTDPVDEDAPVVLEDGDADIVNEDIDPLAQLPKQAVLNDDGSVNLETGIRLVTVAPFPEVARVSVATAFSGGAGEETPAELTAATMRKIRQKPHGGAGFDYPEWLSRKFAVLAVKVVPEWIGRGSVGLVVIMKDDEGSPRVPTEGELDAMLTYLGPPGSPTGVRPVTAHVVMVPGVLTTIPLTIRLRPDTVQTRAAVVEAWTRYIATIGDDDDDQNDGPIGALIEQSRISEAISAASGEYAHDLLLPAANFTLERTEFPVAGDPDFEDD